MSTDEWDHLYASTRYAFQVVQPWGANKALQATVISEHETAAAAFAELDRLASEMAWTGAPPNAVELIVVECATGEIVQRSGAH